MYSIQQRETFILVGGMKQGFTEETPLEQSQERWRGRKIRERSISWGEKSLSKGKEMDGNLLKV